VHPGLIATLNAVSPGGTKVLMNTPTYNGFYSDLRATRTQINDSEMYVDADGVYQIDWDDLEARMTPDCHAMLLCNPQNPTGNCWSEEDLLRIGELCLKHEVTVLADEIHCDFVMKGQKYTPFASLPDKDIVNNSLTFKAISKTFSLAAMKSAYFFSTNPVLLERVRAHHHPTTNTLGVVANEAAYRHGGEWFDQLLPYIDQNHDFAEAFIRERIPLIKYKKAQGTYLAWVDVTELAVAVDAAGNAEKGGFTTPEQYLESWLAENAHVQLQDGSWHGTGGANHMRMNLGAPRPMIEKALNNISEAVKNI
ncbi:MAG: aminotransferase class I/II-fold pyridoxal phosphate-dependent enzyme, partial [Gammaproteobacteria bacterium]|nr:aminotransferase class I/II-fold pyridoxal phosphate-dependent enzyme [Gammaproteobacteria bacterium]